MILFSKNLKKGKIKWIYEVCSYSLALVLLLAILSLCFITENTSALKHEYTTIPAFGSDYNIQYYGLSSGFYSLPPLQFYFVSPDFSSLSVSSDVEQFIGRYSISNFSSNVCDMSGVIGSATRYPRLYDNYISFGSNARVFDSFPLDFNSSSGLETALCYTLFPFSTSSNFQYYDSVHFPNRSGEPLPSASYPDTININLNKAKSYRPFWFAYDHLYLSDSRRSSSTGIVYNNSLKMSDIFNDSVYPNKFYSLQIPFDEWNVDIGGPLTSGRHLDFTGVFTFRNVSDHPFSWSSDFSSSGYFTMTFGYISSDGSKFYAPNPYSPESINTVRCNLTTRQILDDVQVEYSCPFVLSEDLNGIMQPLLTIRAGSSGFIWDFDGDWGWSGAYVITDGDSSPGGIISVDCSGFNCSIAPGSAQRLINNAESENADWFSSLTNLFSFSIFNPFAPIFNLFTNGQSCASIPIIAGMLHAESDQYCSWFPLSVRNVLTPVFSLASVMLLFGFIVRWLGSSSGNFFEDAGHIDSPGGYTADVRGRNVKKRGWRRSA